MYICHPEWPSCLCIKIQWFCFYCRHMGKSRSSTNICQIQQSGKLWLSVTGIRQIEGHGVFLLGWFNSFHWLMTHWKSYLWTPLYSETPYQGTPLYSETPYQGTPLYSETPYQGTPLYSESPYQGIPLYSETPYQGTPLYSKTPYQGTPLYSEMPYWGHLRIIVKVFLYRRCWDS